MSVFKSSYGLGYQRVYFTYQYSELSTNTKIVNTDIFWHLLSGTFYGYISGSKPTGK